MLTMMAHIIVTWWPPTLFWWQKSFPQPRHASLGPVITIVIAIVIMIMIIIIFIIIIASRNLDNWGKINSDPRSIPQEEERRPVSQLIPIWTQRDSSSVNQS